jgi:membrane-bound lytic murein transglycosylase A
MGARKLLYLLLVGSVLLPLSGCKTPREAVEVVRMPPAGGLRKVTDMAAMPDFALAYRRRGQGLTDALDRSLNWFGMPSARSRYPSHGIPFEVARASIFAFDQLLAAGNSEQAFRRAILSDFDVYTSVGNDQLGTVVFTGYYSPIFAASPQQTPVYRYPLYRRPDDLLSDPATGEILGKRDAQGATSTYPTRRQIEDSNMLAGQELVWLKDRLDAYLIHVQGSAKLTMPDGSSMYVGYAGTNGHAYTSLGKALAADGKLAAERLSLPAIRTYFKTHPHELDQYIRRNDRFVFFLVSSASKWPSGSLGFKVEPLRSLATDKSVFPAGMVTLVATQLPNGSRSVERFTQFMLDQDTGGAINAPGRADIYVGIGDDAGQVAGRLLHQGRLYYLLLKPRRVAYWRARLQAGSAAD